MARKIFRVLNQAILIPHPALGCWAGKQSLKYSPCGQGENQYLPGTNSLIRLTLIQRDSCHKDIMPYHSVADNILVVKEG